MKLLQQPEKSMTCGHHCVAMITGVGVLTVTCAIGHVKGTRISELARVLKKMGYECSGRLVRFKQFKDIPPKLAIFRIKYENTKQSHWVVYNEGFLYDPGIPKAYEFRQDLMEFLSARATSYCEVIKK